MIRNTTVLTNSEYNRKAIFEAYEIDGIIVINPPIEVDNFHNSGSSSSSNYDEREDIILAVSRIDPSKTIENAIELTKLLKENDIGKGMIIVGSLVIIFMDITTG